MSVAIICDPPFKDALIRGHNDEIALGLQKIIAYCMITIDLALGNTYGNTER